MPATPWPLSGGARMIRRAICPHPSRAAIRVKLQASPHAERLLALFEGEGADESALGRIFGEELPSGLVLAEEPVL